MTTNTQIPTSWNDLTVDQALKAYRIIMSGKPRLFTEAEHVPAKKILLFKTLSGITDENLHAWKQDCLQHDPEHGELAYLEELNQAIKAVDFLFDIKVSEGPTPETTYAISLTYTRCPFPQLEEDNNKKKRKHTGKKKTTYYAPADALSNISFLELCVTFHLFEQYLQNYSEDLLNELLAVVYRPGKPATKHNKLAAYHGDRRQAYLHHEALVPQRKKKMEKLPKEVKQLIVFWFASCRQHIIGLFPDLFDSKTSGSQGSKYGWAGTLMAMAGSLTQLDQVSSTPAEDALTYLDYLNEQARKAEIQNAFNQ